MKNSLKVFAIAIFATLLLAMSAIAQTSTTGQVEGTLMDANGAVVPGATVTLSGPNLIRSQTTTTDNNGTYRFSAVPPGKYSVKVDASAGFGSSEATNVEVNLSKSTSIDFTLKPKDASAVVDVTASTPEIDQTNNTTGTNVSTEQFSNFPTARTVQSLYTIAPTVTRSGLRDASGRDRDPSVGGSSGPENNYILDGVNTSDPAFGGAGSNVPFEFVQEVEIKTGSYGAEYGKSTGGIFNVVTKSGGNEFHGDVFAYFTAKSMVQNVKASAIPLVGAATGKFSEIDAGADVGGPIIKNKLWFFAAFNPQRRENTFSTQTFHQEVSNKITTPFYAGKLTWGINNSNTFTFSTFGDLTKQDGFLFGLNSRAPNTGFGTDNNQFSGIIKTPSQNYTGRLNSVISKNWTGEFMFGLHKQKAEVDADPGSAGQSSIVDNFAVLAGTSTIKPIVNTSVVTGGLRNAFVDGRGGTLQRGFSRAGFGLLTDQSRNRWEAAARMQNIWGKHTIKYGFEYNENIYKILTTSSGPARTFADPNGEENPINVGGPVPFPATNMPGGIRITNNFGVCSPISATAVQCPTAALTNRLIAMIGAAQGPAGITTVTTNAGLTAAQLSVNPILVLGSVRVRDFLLNTGDGSTKTKIESGYVQDEFRITRNFQLNLGVRFDFQQADGTNSSYIKLNNWFDNMQPRIGVLWDFTGKGKGKFFANYARYLETPIPLDINVRAGGDDIQLDRNANVSALDAPVGSVILQGTASGLGCLGCEATPVDVGIKPQTVNEWTAGIEYQAVKDLTLGFRGIYRAQGSVIEDGSFDDGAHYFLFNPGEIVPGNTEDKACRGDASQGRDPLCFGRARRFYRALEFTATKRFTNHYQMIASYVFSSLIGNYEGLFRNDNGQTDPNITSLFDLPSLLKGTYGRLPNDRPHQLKFNGTYETPFKLMLSGNFYYQTGIPFNALIPHPVYGNNEGFCNDALGICNPRGTAINPTTGSNRTPNTYQLDFGAYYPIKFGEKTSLRLQFDWFNVTNTQKAIRQDETLQINSGISGAQGIQFPNPTFGTGTIFQFPSTFRLGAKFSF
jgi:outer membrane receptor protein involved in Fe transport